MEHVGLLLVGSNPAGCWNNFSFLISLSNMFHLEKVPDGGATSSIFLKKCLAVQFEATQAL